jgi:hypothetical protein
LLQKYASRNQRLVQKMKKMQVDLNLLFGCNPPKLAADRVEKEPGGG